MPWYAFIHPLWQLFGLFLGIKNLSTGFTKTESWTFPLRQHRRLGLLFYIFILSGGLIGWQTNAVMRSQGINFRLSGHPGLAITIIILASLTILSGLLRQSHSKYLQWFQFLHPWLGVIAVSTIFAQLFLVIFKFIGW
ncbi:MAG: hypothetical protein N2201_01145 [candidate division WOR-3 bacterium]|nr:hypothetical protein [candidate division WOR-3 bacterium]